jgi:hypothetical protein
MRIGRFSFFIACLLAPPAADGHPGGLDASGCHNNRKTDEYHCHRGGGVAARAPAARLPNVLAGTYYPNCAAARTAGAAPLRRGDPGYRAGLDRDDDGRACE